MANVSPIFLLSLPRSGSTLLQRIIATHRDVATASEPWVLLPLLGVFDPTVSRSKYGHDLLATAVQDFLQTLRNGADDYCAAVRAFADTLYVSAANGRSHFLDKTPRYHLIARHLVRCFPEAKFVLMWRNPLSVAGSLIHSYGDVWRPHRIHVDLCDGLQELLAVAKDYPDSMMVLRYEDLVEDSESAVSKIFSYLELDRPEDALDCFAKTKLEGNLGDRTGLAAYSRLSAEPLHKWQRTLAGPVRRNWALRYLDWIGEENLSFMGYDYGELKGQLSQLPSPWKGVPSDLVRFIYSNAYLRITGGLR